MSFLHYGLLRYHNFSEDGGCNIFQKVVPTYQIEESHKSEGLNVRLQLPLYVV
jgi:hypothetical protein